MAEFQQRDNSGALFRNDRKKSDDHPTHKGSATIAGVDYWVSAWVNVAKTNGKKYFNMKYEKKDLQPSAVAPSQEGADASFSDDIPF